MSSWDDEEYYKDTHSWERLLADAYNQALWETLADQEKADAVYKRRSQFKLIQGGLSEK